MKVLMATERFLPELGGVEVFTARLAAALIERGHEVALVTSRSGLTECEEDCLGAMPVYRLPFEASLRERDYAGVIALRRRLAALKEILRPDVVHLNTSGASLLFHLLTRRTASAPIVLTVHWLPNLQSVAVVCGQALAAADWVVGVTRGCLDEALALNPDIASRSSVVYNSLPPVALSPTPLTFDPPRLLCLGRLEAQKGFDVALRALATVRRQLPTARLTIAGDGAQRSALEALAIELRLAAAVRFIGWVAPDDVPQLINEHTLVVMPSRYEPFGLVALQAAQMCRPLVASRIAGLSEVIRDGDTGVLCDANDPDAFAAAIVALIRQPATAVRMGEQSRQHVQTAFRWDAQVSAYEALFRRVHAEATGRHT